MSVTFQIEGNPTGKFTAECYETKATLHADSYDLIRVLIAAHKATCEECQAYGLYAEAVMDVPANLDVNMANGNARLVLTALDFPPLLADDDPMLCGSATGEDFLGRVLIALGQDRDDAAVPSVEVPRAVREDGSPVGARMISGGLPEGYVTDRLTALHALALEAVRLGRDIRWA